MVKKQICIIIVTFFSSTLYASKKMVYKAELVGNNNKHLGSIDIPYSDGDSQLAINPSKILEEIGARHKNSFRLEPGISLDHLNNLYSHTPSFSISMPDEKEPLKFFLKFPMDSGYNAVNFLTFDDDNNQLKEGDTISITRAYEVFKDPFGGELFIRLRTPGVDERFTEPLKLGDYKIISSNQEGIDIGEKNSAALSLYIPSIVAVLLLLGVTNFCSYKLGIKKNISTNVNAKK